MTFDPAPIRSIYPFASHWFERGGLRMHYVDEGAGDPIVMVHGNPTWSFYFRELIKALQGSHRVIAPDHIGCGLSDKPDDTRYQYTLSRRIDDLDGVISHIGLSDNITLVLHDWGGAIGMGWAVRNAHRVKRLVFMNTSAFHLPAGKKFPPALRFGRDSRIGASLIRRFNAFSAIAVRVACKKPLSAEIRRGYTMPYNSWANRIATLRFVQDIPLRPGDQAWNAISEIEKGLSQFQSTPALLCWGLQDFVFDQHFYDEMRARLPQAEAHAWGDAGHYVLEDKRDEIIALVQKFLAAHPLEASGR